MRFCASCRAWVVFCDVAMAYLWNDQWFLSHSRSKCHTRSTTHVKFIAVSIWCSSGNKLHARAVHLDGSGTSAGPCIFKCWKWNCSLEADTWKWPLHESQQRFDLLTWDACAALIPGNLDNTEDGGGVSKHTFCWCCVQRASYRCGFW